MKISKEQVRARYRAGTMGYETCLRYLELEYGMNGADADDWLFAK